MKKNKELKKLVKSILEFKLKDSNNMNFSLLKENKDWKLNVKNKKMLGLQQWLELRLKELREKD